MFDKLKTGSSAILGLAIGVLIALPVFWIGVKNWMGALEHGAEADYLPVERRQQVMADEALRFEKLLQKLGWKNLKDYRADFVKVERLRATLAGHADFLDKVEVSQDLERALMNVEKVAQRAAQEDAAIRKNPFVKEFFSNWSRLKRYLVDEQATFMHSVRHYNLKLGTWPISVVISYRSSWALMKSMFQELFAHIGAWLRQGWLWTKYGVLWAVDKVTHKIHPARPAPLVVHHPAKDPLYHPIPQPFYLAEAPPPEENYREIQYDRDYPNMADIEPGEEAPVYENDYRKPEPVVAPTVQKTVAY